MPNESGPGGKHLNCSIGICHGSATEFESLEGMIRIADQALYGAKNNGRATFFMDESGSIVVKRAVLDVYRRPTPVKPQ